jgi:hypothetical protein
MEMDPNDVLVCASEYIQVINNFECKKGNCHSFWVPKLLLFSFFYQRLVNKNYTSNNNSLKLL